MLHGVNRFSLFGHLFHILVREQYNPPEGLLLGFTNTIYKNFCLWLSYILLPQQAHSQKGSPAAGNFF